MKKKSTLSPCDDSLTAVPVASVDAHESEAGGPRKSTLELIRRFARCYTFQTAAAIPVSIILN